MDLQKLLKPKSVAVVGASERDGFGGGVCRNIMDYVQDLSRVYFIHPKRDSVFGHPCHKSLADVDDTIDLVIICTPQATVVDLLRQAAPKGCGGAVVFASGYGEIGNAEGEALEKELIDVAKELNIAVVGPNCAGFINYIDQVQAFAFVAKKRERKGSVGVISQSGQLCSSMIDHPAMRFSYNISAGNGKICQVEDYMEFLIHDEDTKVLTVYIEGVKNPEKFAKVLKIGAEKKKPIVILKAGRSEKGGAIAASHTGSLSGSDKSFDAVLKKYGAIRVDDLEELIGMSILLSTLSSLPTKATFASMNLSGGETGICADVGSTYGIEFPDFTPETLASLREQLPSFATPNNPLDTTASLSYDSELYGKAFKTVMDDPNIGMVLIGYTLLDEVADPSIHYMYKGIEQVINENPSKPVAIIPFAENTRNKEYETKFFNANIPILPPAVYAFKLLKYLSDYVNYCAESKTLEVSKVVNLAEGSKALSEFASKQELAKFGLPVPAEYIVTSLEEAVAVFEKEKTSFAMKIESKDILHKSDVGGVKLNINTLDAVKQAYTEIMENVKKNAPNASINGILMAPMLQKGTEMIIGVNNDPQFGPMIMVGMGGVFVEIFKDVALYPAPLNKAEALDMLNSLKSFPLLNGYRGSEPCDIDALCDTIIKVGDYAHANRNTLKELDINPLFVYPKGKGVGIADALIVLAD